jgi:hypothetical protein
MLSSEGCGDVVILYPNDFEKNNSVKAGVIYSLPDPGHNFDIHITEPAGTDVVKAFFTAKKVDWLDKKNLEGEGLKILKENEKENFIRGIAVAGKKIRNSEWATQAIEVEVVK